MLSPIHAGSCITDVQVVILVIDAFITTLPMAIFLSHVGILSIYCMRLLWYCFSSNFLMNILSCIVHDLLFFKWTMFDKIIHTCNIKTHRKLMMHVTLTALIIWLFMCTNVIFVVPFYKKNNFLFWFDMS